MKTLKIIYIILFTYLAMLGTLLIWEVFQNDFLSVSDVPQYLILSALLSIAPIFGNLYLIQNKPMRNSKSL